MAKIGILHPGAMGVSVAASAKSAGNEVYWASQGRSEQSIQRANEAGLFDAETLQNLCDTCEVILSVCPPDAAEDLSREVIAQGFTGLYLDANAISPGRANRIGELITQAGGTFVDGSIIGGPAWKANSTFLYLSGQDADKIATCFEGGLLETEIIGQEIGKASALKMCFAANTKGMTALMSAILATAESLGVRDELAAQWSKGDPTFADKTNQATRNVTAKAWRFAGEMVEIAQTFEEVGLPGGFHFAAEDVYRRMADFKDAPETPELDEVLRALLKKSDKHRSGIWHNVGADPRVCPPTGYENG